MLLKYQQINVEIPPVPTFCLTLIVGIRSSYGATYSYAREYEGTDGYQILLRVRVPLLAVTRRTSIITIVVVSGITRRRRSQPPREGRPRRGELAAMRVFAVLTGVLSMTGTVAALPQDSADPPDQQNSERPSGVVGNVKDWLIPAGTAAAGVIAGWFGRGFSDKRRDNAQPPRGSNPGPPMQEPIPGVRQGNGPRWGGYWVEELTSTFLLLKENDRWGIWLENCIRDEMGKNTPRESEQENPTSDEEDLASYYASEKQALAFYFECAERMTTIPGGARNKWPKNAHELRDLKWRLTGQRPESDRNEFSFTQLNKYFGLKGQSPGMRGKVPYAAPPRFIMGH